jgi:hypothetical protein
MRALLVASALLVAGCPGHLDHPEQFAAGCPDIEAELLPSSCGSCHGASAPMGGLDLVSPGVGGRLVGTPAQGGPGLLVDPLNPDGSVLVRKLTPAPPFGAQDPPGAPLDPASIDCIRAWVRTLVVMDGGTD